MTKVMLCTCTNKFQDEEYGKNQRLFNLTEKAPKGTVWRCTVCDKEKSKWKEVGKEVKPKTKERLERAIDISNILLTEESI